MLTFTMLHNTILQVPFIYSKRNKMLQSSTKITGLSTDLVIYGNILRIPVSLRFNHPNKSCLFIKKKTKHNKA